MTTQTLTLADFLLARIAEDATTARAAALNSAGRWSVVDRRVGTSNGIEDDDGMSVIYDDSAVDEQRQHIARFDPARVLAECEAKRRIVEHARDYLPMSISCDDRSEQVLEHVLSLLALPYADHPDYRPEWRP